MGALEQNLQKAYVTQPVLKNSDPEKDKKGQFEYKNMTTFLLRLC